MPSRSTSPAEQRELTRQREQRRGLAGPVGAEQAHDLAGAHHDVDLVDHRLRAVARRHAAGLEHRVGRALTASAPTASATAASSLSSSPR